MFTNCLAACTHLTITVSVIERDIGRKSSFFHTPLALIDWLIFNRTRIKRTCKITMKSMISNANETQWENKYRIQSVSMRFRLGWHPIDCSWITPRLKFSDAHLLVDNIRSRLVWSALTPLTCSQFLRPATSGSTSTLACPWGPTSQTAVVRACFAALRQIRSVRRSLSRHALLTLVRALIVSKVDYCNSALAGIHSFYF